MWGTFLLVFFKRPPPFMFRIFENMLSIGASYAWETKNRVNKGQIQQVSRATSHRFFIMIKFASVFCGNAIGILLRICYRGGSTFGRLGHFPYRARVSWGRGILRMCYRGGSSCVVNFRRAAWSVTSGGAVCCSFPRAYNLRGGGGGGTVCRFLGALHFAR